MANEKGTVSARKVYDTLCAAIERREWKYSKDEEKLLVSFGVNGEDIPMQFIMIVDADRQLIRVMSFLPFNFSEEKRIEGAIATCVATYRLIDGSFDYDISTGATVFRMTASFRESLIGEGLFQYMISCSCAVVDDYNDRFLAISKGMLSINDFIESEMEA